MSFSRCLKLAQMHAILLPTPSYSSAIQLTNQATTYLERSRASLFPSGVESEEDPVQEPVHNVQSTDLEQLKQDLRDLETAAKRAWFGQVVKKPLFYDTAFNYVDLPMDALERLAGRASSEPVAPAAIPSVIEKVAQPVVAAAQAVTEKLGLPADAVPARIARESRQREATPGPADETSDEKEQPKSSGWFGGLWGGKK
jgi:signal recognition particle subunit SRP68